MVRKTSEVEESTQQVALCRKLRDAIILGKLHHGQRITEKFISEMMNVKRGPARESLLILEGQGLVRKVSSLGYFVASHTQDEIQDIYDIRTGLEKLAVIRAVKNATREDIVRLRLACDEMRAAIASGDEDRRVREDIAFHEALVEASGSRIIKHMYNSLPRPFYKTVQLSERKTERVVTQHEELCRAIMEKDMEKAVRTLELHISERDFED